AGDGSAPSRVVMSARAPAQPADESAQATSMSASTATPGATARAAELVY
ncbi:MinD/ParA family protein, partial [Salmonella enterica subsp. enterica serovar Mbandaka]